MSFVTFILLLRDSTCFGHQYAQLQEFATMLFNYHIGRLVLDLLCVGARVVSRLPAETQLLKPAAWILP